MSFRTSYFSFLSSLSLAWIAVGQDAASLVSKGPISIYLYRPEQTELLHEYVNAELTIPGKYFEDLNHVLYYNERNRVEGSNEDRVVEYDFRNKSRVSSENVEAFVNLLIDQGLLGENDDESIDSVVSGKWLGSINFTVNEQRESRELTAKLLETVLGFITASKLNIGVEPRELTLHFGINDMVKLNTADSIWSLRSYFGKTVEGIQYTGSELDKGDKVRIRFRDIGDEVVSDIVGNILFVRPELESFIGEELWWVSSNNERVISEGDRMEPIVATVADVLDRPNFYDGKRVQMKGFFHDVFEDQRFYDDSSEKALWLGEISRFALAGTNKKTGFVTVEGIFLKGPSGHFGMSPGEVTRITRFSVIPVSLSYIVLYSVVVLMVFCGGVYCIRRWNKSLAK